MRKRLLDLLVRLTGNEPAQRLLARQTLLAEHLMGIGAGSDVASSGEAVLVAKLRQRQRDTGAPLCVFDVGANQGQFLRALHTGLAGLPAVFHSFEPSRAAFAVLERTAAGWPDVRLNRFGLGARSEEADLHADAPGSPLASLSKRRLAHFRIDFPIHERVQIRTLDAYCAEAGVTGIDLLKIDVEGHDLDVLRGAAETFGRRQVWALTFEFGGGNIDSRTYFQDFWYLLGDYGMRHIFRITPSGYLARVRSYSEAHERFRTTNFLALRDDP